MAVKPLIGITASNRGSRTMTLLNRLAVWRAGGRSVVLQSRRENNLAPLDGLVVGGGDDIGADLYGGELHISVRTDKNRDKLEMDALHHAEKHGLPVLGICRGSQMINIHRGGNLHHDVYEHFEGVPKGRTILAVRHVDLQPDTLLQSLFGETKTRINVLHHQSVDRLGDGMIVNAYDRYGIVQGTELLGSDSTRFLVGVQWHPEFLVLGHKHQGLFRRLMESA